MDLNLNMKHLKSDKFYNIKIVTIGEIELYFLDTVKEDFDNKVLAYKVLDTDMVMLNKSVGDEILTHLLRALDYNNIEYRLFSPANFDGCLKVLLYEYLQKDEEVRPSCRGFNKDTKDQLKFKFFDYKDQETYDVESVNLPLGKKDGKDILIKKDKHYEYRSIKEGNLIQEL